MGRRCGLLEYRGAGVTTWGCGLLCLSLAGWEPPRQGGDEAEAADLRVGEVWSAPAGICLNDAANGERAFLHLLKQSCREVRLWGAGRERDSMSPSPGWGNTGRGEGGGQSPASYHPLASNVTCCLMRPSLVCLCSWPQVLEWFGPDSF